MTSSVESLIKSIGDNPLPPVDKWNPDYCGELGLTIKSDGQWIYQGTPFTRKRMQILFSRVIKKEGNQYFLVTPVEKLGIDVEWMPFTIVDFDCITSNNKNLFVFTDNCQNTIKLIQNEQLSYSQFNGQTLPIIQIRNNLFAGFSRSCYYRLIETAQFKETHDSHQASITSNGINFVLDEYPQ